MHPDGCESDNVWNFIRGDVKCIRTFSPIFFKKNTSMKVKIYGSLGVPYLANLLPIFARFSSLSLLSQRQCRPELEGGGGGGKRIQIPRFLFETRYSGRIPISSFLVQMDWGCIVSSPTSSLSLLAILGRRENRISFFLLNTSAFIFFRVLYRKKNGRTSDFHF